MLEGIKMKAIKAREDLAHSAKGPMNSKLYPILIFLVFEVHDKFSGLKGMTAVGLAGDITKGVNYQKAFEAG